MNALESVETGIGHLARLLRHAADQERVFQVEAS